MLGYQILHNLLFKHFVLMFRTMAVTLRSARRSDSAAPAGVRADTFVLQVH